jgi:hypothetical protein
MRRAAILFALMASPAAADELRDALEAALASGDSQALAALMRDHTDPADQAEMARWFKDKVDTGQAPDRYAQAVVSGYVRAKNLSDALIYLNYYRALLAVDSATCPDPSSGGSLLEATIFLYGRLNDVPGLTADQKRSAVDRALKLEETTASVRKFDPSLCGAGLSRYARALNVTLPNPLGRDAQTAAPSSGLYKDDPAWSKKRSEMLPQLRPMLLMLMGVQDNP